MITRLSTLPLMAMIPIGQYVDRRWLGVAVIALLLVGFVALVFRNTKDDKKK